MCMYILLDAAYTRASTCKYVTHAPVYERHLTHEHLQDAVNPKLYKLHVTFDPTMPQLDRLH